MLKEKNGENNKKGKYYSPVKRDAHDIREVLIRETMITEVASKQNISPKKVRKILKALLNEIEP